MSERTSCNYCKLRDIKWRAAMEGKKVKLVVVTREEDKYGLRGYNYYITKPGETPSERHRAGWFMEITSHCVC